MMETASTVELSSSTGASDTSSDTDSIKSSSADSDSDSLDSEDMNLDLMSTSQFLYLSKENLPQLDPSLSDDDEDNDPTPTSSTHLSLSTVSIIAPHPLATIIVVVPETEIAPDKKVTPDKKVVPAKEIFYAQDSYSPSEITHLLPPFTEAQFVTVLGGDALEVEEESTDNLWVVKVCRTESIGLIHTWNVETKEAQIARFNTEANIRACSTVPESASPNGSAPSSKGSSRAGSTPTTPSSTSDEPSPFPEDSIYVADQSYYRPTKARKVQGVKSVGFASIRPQTVYRYPSERYIHRQWDDSSKVEDQVTSVVWFHGWLESDEEESSVEDCIMDSEASTGMKRKSRGRKRDRRRLPIS